jgi:hypothetical protein
MLTKDEFLKIVIPKAYWSFVDVVNDLCRMFKRDNTNFKPEVFKEACGL